MIRALVLTAALLAPTAALADCPAEVRRAADTVQQQRGLDAPQLQPVLDACGAGGAVRLVQELTARGACDAGAQLGRQLSSWAGMDQATAAADRCLADQVETSIADLERAATRAPSGLGAMAAEEPAAELLADASGSSAAMGALGRGGGSMARPAPARSKKRKRGAYASTGAGEVVGSPLQGRVAAGSQVAWSNLSFGIWFAYDSSALGAAAFGTVGSLAQTVRDLPPGTVLEVVGHTDSTGRWSYNRDLSWRRAQAVEQALTLAGVPQSRLAVRGAGEDQPVASNSTHWGRAQNRRVEFRFYRPVATTTR